MVLLLQAALTKNNMRRIPTVPLRFSLNFYVAGFALKVIKQDSTTILVD